MANDYDIKTTIFKVKDFPKDELKDPNDCHRIPFLDRYIGKRATIVTSKGTIKGYLQYEDSWYYCQALFYLVDGEWTFSHKRFCFRKGQLKSIKWERPEGSSGM